MVITQRRTSEISLNAPLIEDTSGIIEALMQNIFTIKHKNTKLFEDMFFFKDVLSMSTQLLILWDNEWNWVVQDLFLSLGY